LKEFAATYGINIKHYHAGNGSLR